MFDRLKSLLKRWRDTADVESLTERDLSDLGVTRDQVRRFVRMPPDVPNRVVAMGAIYGLSEGELRRNHQTWTDLLEICATCPDRGACRHVLAKAALANPRDAAFCPNRDNFASHWSAI